MIEYALFPTSIGSCAIGWTTAGVSRVLLPEATEELTRQSLATSCAGAREAEPPEVIRSVIARIIALLEGEHVEFADVLLDPAGVPEFHQRVYRVTLGIPAGSTLSYGEVAALLGTPGAARAVGRALGANPYPIVVPCHRVLAASGAMHGFSAPGGVATKRRMLQIEGSLAPAEPTLF